MARLQPLSAKVGEVKFRQELVKQHLGKERSVPNEPDRKEIIKILKKRINSTRKIFTELKNKGFPLSPFLEIGAEKGQRSILLVNEFNASGFASDLSFESLGSACQFAKLLNFKKLPALVCCDAYRLPFANNTFSFVFCFETLHHFPDPTPIINEVYRVLTPGGVFYFGEEPVKQVFNLSLWRRGYHLEPFEKFLKFIGVLPFLSRIGKTEVTHGILEEEFSLETWQKALSVFDQVDLTITPVFFGPSSVFKKDQNHWQGPNFFTQILVGLEGGGVEGYGIKKGRPIHPGGVNSLICPDCQSKIARIKESFTCPRCQREFTKKNGVLMFLPLKLQKKLYG